MEADLETALIRRVAAGDQGAFAELADATHAGLFRYLRSLCRSDEVAEDALQEVLVGVWRGARAWRGDVSGRVWIFGIARRQAARSWRRRAGEPAASESLESLAVAAGGGGDPEQAASAVEEKERVSAALARLSDEDREVIVLRDLEGFSGPEAAALLDVDLGALKSRLHRARLRLMAELREVTDVD